MEYLAHIDQRTGRQQQIIEHLRNTARIAEAFASEFDAGDEAYRCGLLHDIGKYSHAFQRRIKGDAEKPDHSTAGAQVAFDLKDVPAAFCIAGHHGGLPDLGSRKADDARSPTLFGKLRRRVGVDIDHYAAYKTELAEVPSAELPGNLLVDNISCYFAVKMLYSCLVDADFLDTEAFMSDGAVSRGKYESLEIYKKRLEEYIEPWWKSDNELNKARSDILKALISCGRSEKGLFSLTVPTGGGKTVSSMAFSLAHARARGLRRIIYVIPYTSIIDQTQSVFESIFGEGSVVAHHSGAEFGNETKAETKSRQYLAAENWDAPVILTTAVQFFESLYASKSSRCRKLHNIANSVIIFDEAQTLPVPYLTACVAAISQLVKNYGCSAVLCTATQPALVPLFEKQLPGCPVRELCPQVYSKSDVFHRVSFRNDGKLEDGELAARLNGEEQALCIVNSRKQAQRLYAMLEKDGSYHLSTMMYPEHRKAVLAEIRERLRSRRPCRVVSTSLVEAGVDVDFPTVYRAIAGVDSMIQAAGRCNREGKRPTAESVVHIFDTPQKPPAALEQNICAARRTLERHEEVASADAVRDYFNFLLYTLKDEKTLDSHSIVRSIDSGTMAFRDIADRFHIIDGCGCTVYIPLGRGEGLAAELVNGAPTKALLRKLGQYSVGVYDAHYRQLLKAGAVEPVAENAGVLRDMSLYSSETGLCFGTDEGKGVFI